MGSEKPPRRSKAKQEPGIIDLDATSEPGRASSDEALSEALTELPDAVPVDATADEKAPSSKVPANEATELPNAEAPKPTDEEKPEEIGTAEALAAEAALDSPPEAPSPNAVNKPGSAGALVAGLLGGIIALAGAGGLQYAGYLPALRSPPPAPEAAGTADLEAQISALKSQIAALASKPAAPQTDVSALEARIAALEVAPAASPAPAAVDLTPLEQKIATLDSQLSQLEGAVAGTDEKQQSIQTNLVDRLQKVEADVNDPARRNAVARAIAASGLKAAIDRGGSFIAELETFAGVAANDPAIAGLKPYAETGVPTRATLTSTFPDAANAALAVLNRPAPDQGVFERLWSSAQSLVKVRPVGHVEGDTPEAFIARAEEALKSGDLDVALTEWNRVPEEGRSAAPDFGKALAARIAVEKLVGATLKDAVLGASGN